MDIVEDFLLITISKAFFTIPDLNTPEPPYRQLRHITLQPYNLKGKTDIPCANSRASSIKKTRQNLRAAHHHITSKERKLLKKDKLFSKDASVSQQYRVFFIPSQQISNKKNIKQPSLAIPGTSPSKTIILRLHD